MLYEDQNLRFDKRAGIPESVRASVAEMLVRIVDLKPGQSMLEIGAGTGEFSLALLDHDIQYIGFDRSEAMLATFRQKLEPDGRRATIVTADGNGPWPVAEGSIDVVFSARAIHHLDPDHVVAETKRVASPGGVWLVLARLRRPPESVKALMRREMLLQLKEQGYVGKSHVDTAERIFASLEVLGCNRVGPHGSVRWRSPYRPADSLSAWSEKKGLAGLDVTPEVKAAVLSAVRRWARNHYGDLDREHEQEEWVELDAIFWSGTDHGR